MGDGIAVGSLRVVPTGYPHLTRRSLVPAMLMRGAASDPSGVTRRAVLFGGGDLTPMLGYYPAIIPILVGVVVPAICVAFRVIRIGMGVHGLGRVRISTRV